MYALFIAYFSYFLVSLFCVFFGRVFLDWIAEFVVWIVDRHWLRLVKGG